MQEKKRETHRRCRLWGCKGGSPGLCLPGLLGGVRGAGGAPRALQPPPRLEPSPKSFTAGCGGGLPEKKKYPPYPDQIQVMGGGRRKALSAGSAEPTGLHPASTVRCRHKAAPPPPLPTPARPGPHPPPLPTPHALWPARGGGWASPGLAVLGRRRRRRPSRLGRSSPARERGREPGSRGRPPARGGGWGGGRVWSGGAFLETLAKYSRRIGAFLEMRRRRQPRPMGGQRLGFSKLGGNGGDGRSPTSNTPAARRREPRLGLPPGGGGGRIGFPQMRSRDPSAGGV